MLDNQRYTRNSAWMLSEKCLRLLLGVFVGIWIARHLGPEQFGLLSFAIAVAALVSPLARAGLDSILIRELIDDPSREAEIFRAAFHVRLAGSVLAMALVFAAVLVFSGTAFTGQAFLVLIVSGSLIFQPFDVFEQYFQARVDARASSICRMIQTVLMALLRVGLILGSVPLPAFAAAIVLESLILALLLWFAARSQKGPGLTGPFSTGEMRRLVREAWPMVLSGLAVIFYMRIDQVMIDRMLGAHDLGLYSAALKVSELWFALMAVFATSVLPLTISGTRKGDGEIPPGFGKMLSTMFWLNVLIAILVSLTAKWVIPLLFGMPYVDSVQSLLIHIWTGPLVALGLLSGNWLIARRLQSLAFLRTLFGAFVNLILNFALIPRMGIAGAALASLFAQLCAAFLFDLAYPQTRKMFLTKVKAIFLLPESS